MTYLFLFIIWGFPGTVDGMLSKSLFESRVQFKVGQRLVRAFFCFEVSLIMKH